MASDDERWKDIVREECGQDTALADRLITRLEAFDREWKQLFGGVDPSDIDPDRLLPLSGLPTLVDGQRPEVVANLWRQHEFLFEVDPSGHLIRIRTADGAREVGRLDDDRCFIPTGSLPQMERPI